MCLKTNRSGIISGNNCNSPQSFYLEVGHKSVTFSLCVCVCVCARANVGPYIKIHKKRYHALRFSLDPASPESDPIALWEGNSHETITPSPNHQILTTSMIVTVIFIMSWSPWNSGLLSDCLTTPALRKDDNVCEWRSVYGVCGWRCCRVRPRGEPKRTWKEEMEAIWRVWS